ncbi:MAG: polyprenyl synthetase family protein [Halobacteriales archaeon]|nr:polyprenyl synthetase family protein [Halobacteriales archaeon]
MEYLEARRSRVEDRLTAVVAGIDPAELSDRIDHAALSGGKRVRPTVTVLACEALGGDPEDAVDFAVGIELIHSASLVIDDIIDESAVRRGAESAWAEYGHGGAVIASDGLIGEAFRLFSKSPRAMERVADAMVDLGEGEAAELVTDPADEAAYMELARQKTGALFRAAAELGAIAAGAPEPTVDGLGRYAERVGIAFQIRDDVLDAVADPGELGKPTGQDAAMERPSLVRVAELTAEEANSRAREQADLALEALDGVDIQDPTARDYLADLAEFVVTREH